MEKPAQIRLKDYMTMVSSDDEKNFVDQWDVGGQKQGRRLAR